MASSKPSFPAPSEPNLRRLGVGGGGGGDRPLRAQLIVAGVVILMIVAIPLYILRRPSAEPGTNDPKNGKVVDPGLIRAENDAGPRKIEIELGPVQRVKCSAAPNRQGNEGPLCDRLPAIEKDLAKSIRANFDCAPRTGKAGTINYVLTLDFVRKRVHVFPGASGEWKGPQAKAAAKCVKRTLAPVDWENTPHRYRYYMMAILASYPAPDPLEGFPEFE